MQVQSGLSGESRCKGNVNKNVFGERKKKHRKLSIGYEFNMLRIILNPEPMCEDTVYKKQGSPEQTVAVDKKILKRSTLEFQKK